MNSNRLHRHKYCDFANSLKIADLNEELLNSGIKYTLSTAELDVVYNQVLDAIKLADMHGEH